MQALLEHFITQSTVYSLMAVVLVAFLESLALVGLILPGTVLMAGAVNCAFASAGLVTGGFSGVAIIVRHFTELPVWLISALLNVPLFLFAAKRRGGPFLRKALTGGIFLPFFLALVPEIPLTGQDVFLAALFGGALQGVGLGLVFAAGGTTGGTDLTATLLRDFFPGI